jgi:ABC-type Fe3+/spermidine/putrescine transport system ATPase subunit
VVPDGGRILCGGRDITDDPPYHRDAGLVFQSYALFLHMSVGENVGFVARKPDQVERHRTRSRITAFGAHRIRSPYAPGATVEHHVPTASLRILPE